MEVKIHIETECPVPNQTTDLKITLENVENIGDLKKKLQPLLGVAACDMSVYYKTKNIKLENKKKFSNLYVQEGDTFIVYFVSVCNLHFFTELLDNMRAFVENVCEKFEQEGSIKWKAFDNVAAVIDECYNTVIHGLERCSYDTFIPWNYRPTNSNRHYFVQEGGMELLARIYNFASRKQYPMGDSEEDSQIAKHFNGQQDEMEIFCLLCLWNFSETKEDRQLVLMKIGLEPFLHSLLKDIPDVHNYFLRVDEVSVGCLAQYVELPDIQQILAENMEVLSKLLWLTSNASDSYHREVPANTLFCCSNHPKAAEKLIRNQFYRLVLEKYEADTERRLESSDSKEPILAFTSAIGYFFCLFLANIQTLPEDTLLPYEEIERINQVLETFLHAVKPSEIGQFQETHNYVWITLLPFMQLALAGPIKYLEMEHDRSPTRFQVFAKSRPEMENKFQESSRNNQSSDKELSKSIETSVKTEDKHDTNSRNENRENEENSNNNGSLRPYIFSSAEKVGLFCLCHLADAPSNRDLFKKEKLVDYLVCVRWFAQRCPELAELTPKLDGFEHLEPPRLESIAKAYLSKCFGYKIM